MITLPLLNAYSENWIIVDYFTKLGHIILMKDDPNSTVNLKPIFARKYINIMVKQEIL
jgi:hypothetical protein